MHELDNVVFTTKSVMLTDKQKDMISDLLDQLCDLGCDEFDNIEYWKLSKQEASKLISKMLDKIEYLDYINFDKDFDPIWDVGDN
jgi:DNA-binding MarR family transcriptional regulator